MAWKNVRIGGKFTIGFGIVLVLLALVVGWSIFGIRGIVNNAKTVIQGNKLKSSITRKLVDHLEWVSDLNTYMNDDSVTTLSVQTDPRLCAFGKWYFGDERRQAEALVPAIKPLLAAIEAPHRTLHESAIKIEKNFVIYDAALGSFVRDKKVDHLIWVESLLSALLNPGQRDLGGLNTDPKTCDFGKWLYSADVETLMRSDPAFDKVMTPLFEPHLELHESAAVIGNFIQAGRREEARLYYYNTTKPLADETLSLIDGVIGWFNGKTAQHALVYEIYNKETAAALTKVKSLLEQVVTTVSDNIMSDEIMLYKARQTNIVVLLIGGLSILLGFILALVISRGIVRPILKGVAFAKIVARGDLNTAVDVDQKDEIGQLAFALNDMIKALKEKAAVLEQIAGGDLSVEVSLSSEKDVLGKSMMVVTESLNSIIHEINEGMEQISTGSDQVSQSSQSLSQGATEQASSLEQITASVNEINGQSRDNAKNAEQANSIAKQAAADAEKGNDNMKSLVHSMELINVSSGRIKKVVKVIDDIAFQINLLALNANVEAARAGKYGKGFAVVADEVRNLAVRSAEAVKETTAMVEDSLKNIRAGNSAAENTAKQLSSIVGGVIKVAHLLEDITHDSIEQANAISQITSGLDQIDQVTQTNTASAEQSASAAEELAAQAQQIKALVSHFNLADSAVRRALPGYDGMGQRVGDRQIPAGGVRQKRLEITETVNDSYEDPEPVPETSAAKKKAVEQPEMKQPKREQPTMEISSGEKLIVPEISGSGLTAHFNQAIDDLIGDEE